MELSILIAKIISVIYISASIGVLIKTINFNEIVNNIQKIVKENPNKNILVAIGIDHKYYIEEKLEKHNIKVYQVDNIKQFSNNYSI